MPYSPHTLHAHNSDTFRICFGPNLYTHTYRCNRSIFLSSWSICNCLCCIKNRTGCLRFVKFWIEGCTWVSCLILRDGWGRCHSIAGGESCVHSDGLSIKYDTFWTVRHLDDKSDTDMLRLWNYAALVLGRPVCCYNFYLIFASGCGLLLCHYIQKFIFTQNNTSRKSITLPFTVMNGRNDRTAY